MKDIKHINRDFHSIAWVMPQGSDLGVLSGAGGSTFFFSEMSVSDLHQWHMQRQNFLGPHPLGPWEGPKCQIS